MRDDLDPPQSSAEDAIYKAIKVTLTAIPGVGGAAAELFAAVFAQPIQKRRDEWYGVVCQTLRRLQEEHGVPVDQLRESPTFIDCVLQATQIALRNSQEEKRDALRNAILTAGLPHAPDQSLQQIFLSYVDFFTVWHIRLLALFDDLAAWFSSRGRAIPDVNAAGLLHLIVMAYPELSEQREFYDQVWRDLYLRGLVSVEQLHTTMTGAGLLTRRSTEAGRQFLTFIRAREAG